MQNYNEIPWKEIKGMRDKIVHGYDSINLLAIYSTASNDIPELYNYCKSILN